MRATLALLFAAACATPELAVPPAPTRLEAVPPAAPPFDARAFAAEQLTPSDCEGAARRLHDHDADRGWDALKACVERTRWPRGEFTLLERLAAGFWDRELQSRPDAPLLVVRVVALRGGDVEGDIPLAQKSRVPLFTLAAAMRQPEVYKGRWVVLRGALSDLKQDGAKAAALVREMSLRATAHEVQVGAMTREERTSSGTFQGGGSASRLGAASGGGQFSSRERSERSLVKQRFDNERVATGRHAVGKLPQADPFLEPDKDFVLLGRFEGVTSGGEEGPVAVLSIAAYFAPNELLVQ